MVDKSEFLKIISQYKQLSEIRDIENGAIFNLHGNQYVIFNELEHKFPKVYAINCSSVFPHFMSFANEVIDGNTYTPICLAESGTVIEYIHTENEKIEFCIEQLIKLTELSKDEIVREYQSEFLVYWGWSCHKSKYARNNYQIYVDDEENYHWFEQQIYQSNVVRITDSERFFNDSEKKVSVDKIPVLYLPLKDIRNLMPPLFGQQWQGKDIFSIVSSVSYPRISEDAYDDIKNLSYSYKSIMLVFKLSSYYFGCIVEFKNSGTAKLINKLETQIEKVFPVRVNRCDFDYVNKQIGNRTHKEKIAIVGVGSLGSYVASELVRSGYRDLILIDEDTYEPVNAFRHRIEYFSWRHSKSLLMSFQLNNIHPEVNVKPIEKTLSEETFNCCELENADIIIFTVGSSDVQLSLNSFFKTNEINKRIMYAWLECDGKTCHVASIYGFENGCFECIFTDQLGNLCPNAVNIAPQEKIEYIRNGCGGTRVPYGNRVLLDASSIVLKALDNSCDDNFIISFANDSVVVKSFPKNERCKCCGI